MAVYGTWLRVGRRGGDMKDFIGHMMLFVGVSLVLVTLLWAAATGLGYLP